MEKIKAKWKCNICNTGLTIFMLKVLIIKYIILYVIANMNIIVCNLNSQIKQHCANELKELIVKINKENDILKIADLVIEKITCQEILTLIDEVNHK